MTAALRTLIALPMFCAVSPAVAAPTHAELQAVAERQVCESPGVTRMLFSGYSSQLAECLERLGNSDGPIDELRITSRGGEAWATLPRRRACWILVTPEMAARCLKGTKIDSFAAPEAQDAFEVRLGFFRALK